MKNLRKWSRILHRNIGFFFIGTSIIYGLSGIALNHLRDWNPNYIVTRKDFTTNIDLSKSENVKENALNLLDKIDNRDNYKSHYFPNENNIRIFLRGGSSVSANTISGEGVAEFIKKRAIFYQSNVLHYNPNSWWKWFSDAFALSLILFAVTSLIMVRGKRGIWGIGGVYTLAGIIIPILFLIFM